MASRQEWLAFHEKVFAMLDKDHKGSVNASDFLHSNRDEISAFATGGFANGLQTAEMMQKIDTSGDGLVSRDEYMANQRKVFDFMDTSKDHRGMLSPAEVLAGGPRR
jgi:Ca2+-binding EF-hand superfamily protein